MSDSIIQVGDLVRVTDRSSCVSTYERGKLAVVLETQSRLKHIVYFTVLVQGNSINDITLLLEEEMTKIS